MTDGPVHNRHGAPLRILAAAVGSLWPDGGRFSSRWWMLAADHLVFAHGTATACRREHADSLYAAVAGAGSFAGLRAAVEAHGLTVVTTA